MKFKAFAAAALAFSMALSVIGLNPGSAKAGDNGLFGAAIGAAGGGFLGSHIGSGDGRLAATAAGTLLGAVIGANMAQAGDYDPYGDGYRIVQPRPQPRYVAPTPPRKVVVHKRQVIVKHVYPDGYGKAGWKRGKGWKKKRREHKRRRLAQACYDHPRRCASAF